MYSYVYLQLLSSLNFSGSKCWYIFFFCVFTCRLTCGMLASSLISWLTTTSVDRVSRCLLLFWPSHWHAVPHFDMFDFSEAVANTRCDVTPTQRKVVLVIWVQWRMSVKFQLTWRRMLWLMNCGGDTAVAAAVVQLLWFLVCIIVLCMYTWWAWYLTV